MNNKLFLYTGLASIVAGYVSLNTGDIGLAPILLVVGYCVLIPIYLYLSFRTKVGV
jgi:hypothetical protein